LWFVYFFQEQIYTYMILYTQCFSTQQLQCIKQVGLMPGPCSNLIIQCLILVHTIAIVVNVLHIHII
jgi:hypothetical protein